MKACQPPNFKKLLSTASVQNDNDNQASKPLILLGSKWELPVDMPLAQSEYKYMQKAYIGLKTGLPAYMRHSRI